MKYVIILLATILIGGCAEKKPQIQPPSVMLTPAESNELQQRLYSSDTNSQRAALMLLKRVPERTEYFRKRIEELKNSPDVAVREEAKGLLSK